MSRKTRRAKARAKPQLWQSPLLLEEVREVDPDGRIVVHHRVVNTLGRMLKAGTITDHMAEAGRKFERQFILAQLDPLRATGARPIPATPASPPASRWIVRCVRWAATMERWAPWYGTSWGLAARSGSGRCGRAGTAGSCAPSRRRGC